MKAVAGTFVILLALIVPGFAFDFMTGHGNGLGQALMLSHSSPSMLLNAPTGGLAPGEWQIETGLNRLYDMKELDQAFIAGAHRWRYLTGSIGFSQFGQRDYYSERTAKLGVAYLYREWVVGGYYSYRAYSFGGLYEGLSASAFGLGGSYRRDRVYIAANADNLNSPVLDPSSPAIRPVYSVYGEFRTSTTLSTVSRMRFERGVPPQFAIGQRIMVSSRSSLIWGLQSAPLQFGGGVEVGISRGKISYSASYHPTLGLSHTISVSYGSRVKSEGSNVFK